MRDKWEIIKKYKLWLFALLVMDLFFGILLWIVNVRAFFLLLGILIGGSLLLFIGVIFIVVRKEMQIREAFEQYIYDTSKLNEDLLMMLCSKADEAIIQQLGKQLYAQKREKEALLMRATDYEEYVEAWAHETKTPLSLLTMLIDNHKDEMLPDVTMKLDYIRNRMQENVDQMLFYARLKGEKKDYLLEPISLMKCLEDILEDYKPLLEESHFQIEQLFSDVTVYSDRRGLKFILSQIVSNALKYCKKEGMPKLMITCENLEDRVTLSFQDNGIGIRECDLPYIFEKGFTGDTGESRKRATGMGLYLAKEMAKDLKLILDARSEWQKGFEMRITFIK